MNKFVGILMLGVSFELARAVVTMVVQSLPTYLAHHPWF